MLRTTALLLAFVALSISIGCIRGDDDDINEEERERAIAAAMEVYEEVAATGQDLSNGPCIADELDDVPSWSVDIAHDPRQEIDNDTANQCQAYRDGRTTHFVELDPEGELIRAQ
jgi:hypothetical protein